MIAIITDYATGNVGGVQVPLPSPLRVRAPEPWLPGLISFNGPVRRAAIRDARLVGKRLARLSNGVTVW